MTSSDSAQHNVPRHIAIIMDGNGRWAEARGKNRLSGHKQGVISVLNTIEAASMAGVEFLTLYTFSTENWNRPATEVDGLMELFVASISHYTEDMIKKGVRLKFIGDRQGLSDKVRQAMETIEQRTAHNTTITVMPAVNYGGRQEILHAVKTIARDVQNSTLSIEEIDQQSFSAKLYTADTPDPELMIRTSGEMRISNFLLWQLSYAEFYICDVHWPEFSKEEFHKALESYKSRGRRFGGVKNVTV